MSSNAVIYLSGGMEKSTDQGARWRQLCSKQLTRLNYTPIDVTALDQAYTEHHGRVYNYGDNNETNLLQYKSNIRRQFIYADLRLIEDNSDAVIAYYDEPFRRGAGSFAECQHAYDFEKPLFIVSEFPTMSEIPGWLKALSTKIFFNFEDLYTYLASLPEGILKKDQYGNHRCGNQYLCSLCGFPFKKAKHNFVSKLSPLYCKSCVDIVTDTYEAQADRYQFFTKCLNK